MKKAVSIATQLREKDIMHRKELTEAFCLYNSICLWTILRSDMQRNCDTHKNQRRTFSGQGMESISE